MYVFNNYSGSPDAKLHVENMCTHMNFDLLWYQV